MSRIANPYLERALQLAAIVLLLIGSFWVLQPFLVAVVFAAVVATSTWPAYAWLHNRLGRRRNLAAFLLVSAFAGLLVAPMVGFSLAVAEGLAPVWEMIKSATQGTHFASLLEQIPWVGNHLANLWTEVAGNDGHLQELLSQVASPAQGIALRFGRALGTGAAQAVLAVFFLFFIYRDGAWLTVQLRTAVSHLVGDMAAEVLRTAQFTVLGVMLGMIGTAAAQGVVATIGFLVAGVPAAFILGACTFFASLIPIGPPLIWGGAAIWLWRQDEIGWAIFMVLYGIFLISAVDNLVKPLIISRTSALPLPVALIGVGGGVLAFGLAGLFVGPTLLALTINLGKHWLASKRANSATSLQLTSALSGEIPSVGTFLYPHEGLTSSESTTQTSELVEKSRPLSLDI